MKVKMPDYADILNARVQNPPSEEKLARTLCLQTKQEKAYKRFVCPAPALAGIFMAFASAEWHWLGLGLGFFSFVLAMALLFKLEPCWDDCAPIDKGLCKRALKLFSESPEGLAYLQKIRDMGREVTGYDLRVVEHWNGHLHAQEAARQAEAHQAAEEKACRELYGIEEGIQHA